MPFRFLKSIMKTRPDKLKKRSKSTADISQADINIPSDPSLKNVPSNKLETRSKSKLQLFSKSKSSLNVNIKEAKNNKDNKYVNNAGNMESKKRESVISFQFVGTESTQTRQQKSSDQDMSPDHSDKIDNDSTTDSIPKRRPTRSVSCCAFMDGTQRDRRLSDLAQLDQYINYHQRRGTDDGNTTNRLLCAQILRQSLLKLEDLHKSDLLRSKDNPNMSRSMTNLNHLHNVASNSHFQKNKVNQTRRSSQWSFVQHQEPRLSVCDGDKRRSWISVNSDDKDEDAGIQFTCNSDHEFDGTTDNVPDYATVPENVDIFSVRDFFKKPKFMAKRRSVPSFTAAEIEIF